MTDQDATGEGAVRVLLVEDHPVFRKGLRDALEAEAGLQVVAEAGDGESALDLARRHRPAVAVVDLQLPGIHGIEVVQALAAMDPPVPAVLLSAHHHGAYVRSAVAAGAHGYLLKDEPAATIVQAVKGAAAGRRGWLSRAVAAELQQAWHDPLTPKETEVVRLLAQGQGVAEVAAELEISVRTVRNHLGNVYSKLDLHSQPEVVAWAWRSGLAGLE
jgi:DNA-binding NarL/FixJ family response regulator